MITKNPNSKIQIPNSKFQIKKKGFTLIELLVVIGIITMVISLMFPNFMGARQRARDSQRKADVKQLQSSLELYKLDHDAYPSGSFTSVMCRKCWSATPGPQIPCPAGNIYMNKFSCDPGTNDPQTPYIYERNSTDNLRYSMTTCLENVVDSDRDPTANPTCEAGNYASYTVSEP